MAKVNRLGCINQIHSAIDCTHLRLAGLHESPQDTSASPGCMNLLKALATSKDSFISNFFIKSSIGEELGVRHDASFLTLTLSLPWGDKKRSLHAHSCVDIATIK